MVICIKENYHKFLQFCGLRHAYYLHYNAQLQCKRCHWLSLSPKVPFRSSDVYLWQDTEIVSLIHYFYFALQRSLCTRMKQYGLFIINTWYLFWHVSIFNIFEVMPWKGRSLLFLSLSRVLSVVCLRLQWSMVRLCSVQYVVRAVPGVKGGQIFKAL